MLKLKNKDPVSKGRCRLVFEHPASSDLLVKVIRPDVLERRFGKGTQPWRFKKNRRYGQYISFHREMQEYLVSRAESTTSRFHVQTIVGFADTDLGLGMIVEAVRNVDGTLALPLGQLIKSGLFDEEAEEALERFFSQMLASRIVFSDLNLGALVYQSTRKEFIMIDGLGITNPIPIKALSSWANRRSKEKRFAKFRAKVRTMVSQKASQ